MPLQKTSLDVFIPEDRRQALRRGESLPTRSHGAVLFADISGFTQLTSVLSADLGPQRGAEELIRQLDPIYTDLVHAIHSYRGSVIVISGDGITCWFDRDDGRRAATCAFAMQRIMAQYETIRLPTGQAISLGIRITLSVGPVQRFLVGNPDIQLIEALAGRELDEVVAAQELLESGEIAVGENLLRIIEADVIVRARRETTEGTPFAVIEEKNPPAKADPWPDIAELSDEVARKWVFSSVYNRIRAEEIEFLTELRQGVPMFVKFTGLDYDDDEHAGDKLDLFIRQIQAVLARYEGYLCQLTIGDKGSNVFIAFGAPIAHEDDVHRALSAALELREKTAELGFIEPVRISLTYGQLWAGANGGREARTYSVMGAEVNLAAHLMGHANPGQILVSPHIVDTTSNYSFAPLAPFHFKGLEKPMTPFVLLGKARAQSVPLPQNRMFGRSREQDLLIHRLIRLANNGGRSEPAGAILVEGEAGIGKSLLLADLIEKGDQMGIRSFSGSGDPIERATPYHGIRPVFETLFDVVDEDDPLASQERVRAAVQGNPFLTERLPLLSEVIPLRMQDNELTGQMLGEARATSIREFLLEVLRHILVRDSDHPPAAIVLDDAHWLDSATWDLAGHISRELPGIQVAIGMRPLDAGDMGEQSEAEYRRLRDDPTTTYVQLRPLPDEDIVGLVARKLGVRALPDPVLAFIQARAQGNPFFSEEITYALRDAGVIQLENDEVVHLGAEDLGRIDFPQTIQGVITSRIDRLSPAHQLTLKVASVIGRAFLTDMLSNVHPSRIGTPTLVGYLITLTQLGITELEASTPELTYLFKHVITQEVVYNLLTFAQRQQLHCAVAEWYEATYNEDPSPHYPRLAHHWLKGEVLDKAIHYLDKAAEQALELYANEDVVRFISIAVDLTERSTDPAARARPDFEARLQRARWERMLGTAHFRLGHLRDAGTHLARTLELLGRPIPSTRPRLILNVLKELIQQISHRLFPRLLKRPLNAEQRAVYEELARVGIESVLYYSQNNLLLAWGMLRRLNLAERLGDPALMVQVFSNMQLIVGLANLRRPYETYRRLRDEALVKAGRTSVQIYAFLREAVVHFIRCEWQEAYDDFDAGLQLAEPLGDNRQWNELTAAKATSLHLQGQFEKAQIAWQGQYRKLARSEPSQTMAWNLYGQGHNLLMLGHVDEAIRLIEASIGIPMKDADDKILNTSRYSVLSLAYLRNGEFGKSLENVLHHQRWAPRRPSLSSTLQEYEAMVEAVLGLTSAVGAGEFVPSPENAGVIEQIFRRVPRIVSALRSSPVNKAGTFFLEGTYHELTGDLRRARLNWERCIELADEYQQPYQEGRARYRLALHTEGPERTAHLEKARGIFGDLHTPYELELVAAALG